MQRDSRARNCGDVWDTGLGGSMTQGHLPHAQFQRLYARHDRQELFSWSGGRRCSVESPEFVVPVSHPGEDAHCGSSWITRLSRNETRDRVSGVSSLWRAMEAIEVCEAAEEVCSVRRKGARGQRKIRRNKAREGGGKSHDRCD